jgi:hypothetical protein
MGSAKGMAEQYLEAFASEIYSARKNNRSIDPKIWENMLMFVTRGIQAKGDSFVK